MSGAGPTHAPLAGEALAAAAAHVAAWQAAEAVKAATAKAKNDLESYIIATRERLETDEAMQQVGGRPPRQCTGQRTCRGAAAVVHV